MLFNEIYGSYYDVLIRILSRAVEGTLTRENMDALIRDRCFEESILTIPKKLADGSWPLLRPDLTTPLRHKPDMPLTTLQKRWLKTILQDPRIRLFDPPTDGLEDVEPLYPQDSVVWFDRYADGDPFGDPGYIDRFHTILTALREKRWLRLEFHGRDGTAHVWRCVPYRLEYSSKDDKFRLITANKRAPQVINLARLSNCTLLDPAEPGNYWPAAMRKQTLVLELTDERNALERCMLHFSHLEKETERIDENRYRLTLRYEQDDETELLIRVLSFGPMLKVLSPDWFRRRLQKRIQSQLEIGREKITTQ